MKFLAILVSLLLIQFSYEECVQTNADWFGKVLGKPELWNMKSSYASASAIHTVTLRAGVPYTDAKTCLNGVVYSQNVTGVDLPMSVESDSTETRFIYTLTLKDALDKAKLNCLLEPLKNFDSDL